MRRASLLLLLPVAACFPSLDSLTGGDASLGDAASDTASFDAATDAQVETGPFCTKPSSHFLCDDFDESGFLSQWTKLYVDDGGSLTQDTDFVSPPSSLRCYLPNGTQGGIGARVSTTTPPSSAAHVAFRIKIGSGRCDAGGDDNYYELVKFGGDQSDGFGIKVNDNGWYLHLEYLGDAGGVAEIDSPYLAPNPASDTWHDVSIDVTFAKQGAFHLAVDGTNKADLVDVDTLSFQENTSIELGTYSSGSCAANDVRYDNVVIDLTP